MAKPHPRDRTVADRLARHWYNAYKTVMGPVLKAKTQLEVHGLSHVSAQGPFILVSNHRSNQDPLILSSLLPHHVRWVVAAYMRNAPVSGWLMTQMGVIYAGDVTGYRRSLLREGVGILQRGGIVGIFPEGEAYIFQQDFAAPLAPFSRGFAALAIRTQASILPAVIHPIREVMRPAKVPEKVRVCLTQQVDLASMQIPHYRVARVTFGRPIPSQSSQMSQKRLVAAVRTAMLALQEGV